MNEQEQLLRVVAQMRKVRREKNISQMELALRANLTQSYIANVENGKKQPSLLTVLKIANALDVSPQEFFNVTKSEEKRMSFVDMYEAFREYANKQDSEK